MNAIIRWIVFIFLIFIAFQLVNKGLELRSFGTNIDGEGIGIHFLGLEINDRVSEENISTYAVGFFISSMIILLAALVFIGKKILSKT